VEEDMTYISDVLLAIGYAMVGVVVLMSIFFLGWVVYYRQKSIIRASQPEFLAIFSFGCIILVSSIIPSSVQGEYRYIQDPVTGQLTDEANPDIGRVDAACMAEAWLFGIGFVVVFSALFAKIWRIKRVNYYSQTCRRVTVGIKDVAGIVIFMLFGEVTVLLVWQLVDPLRWQREVLSVDAEGRPLQSVGSCTSESSEFFVIPLCIFNGLCLLFALYLCYVIRNVPSKFSEAKWITAAVVSIFQILSIAVPILFIVGDDTDIFFFVRASINFLMCSTVTLLIYVPKCYRQHFATEDSGAQFSNVSGLYSGQVSQSNVSRFYSEQVLDSSLNFVAAEQSGHSFGDQVHTSLMSVSRSLSQSVSLGRLFGDQVQTSRMPVSRSVSLEVASSDGVFLGAIDESRIEDQDDLKDERDVEQDIQQEVQEAAKSSTTDAPTDTSPNSTYSHHENNNDHTPKDPEDRDGLKDERGGEQDVQQEVQEAAKSSTPDAPTDTSPNSTSSDHENNNDHTPKDPQAAQPSEKMSPRRSLRIDPVGQMHEHQSSSEKSWTEGDERV
jgi:hypothetical protein